MIQKQKRRKKRIKFWHNLNQVFLRYEYKHATLAMVCIFLFVIFFDSAIVATMLGFLENLGYVGGFIAGVLSASFVTAIPAVVVLLDLSSSLDPFALAVVAGAGAMVGDWLILLFLEDGIVKELTPVFKKLHLHEIVKRLRYKHTVWILWLVGGLSLATPLPDELGIAILGISHFKPVYLLVISFTLNTIGFYGLILATHALK